MKTHYILFSLVGYRMPNPHDSKRRLLPVVLEVGLSLVAGVSFAALVCTLSAIVFGGTHPSRL